jgi:hypothetical protein
VDSLDKKDLIMVYPPLADKPCSKLGRIAYGEQVAFYPPPADKAKFK